MSIYCDVFPYETDPNKLQIENLLNWVDQKYVTNKIIDKFGLTKSGEKWVITRVSLDVARRMFQEFYSSLPKSEKLHFQWLYFKNGFLYLHNILENMSKAGLNSSSEHTLLLQAFSALEAKMAIVYRGKFKSAIQENKG